MAVKIQYVGPKDSKTFAGMRFPRLVPIEVPNTVAAQALQFPDVFLPADVEVPAEILAQRDALPLALEKEGRERIEQYQMVKAQASLLPHGNIDEKTDKPDTAMQKRIDAMQGAQDEIDAGQALVDAANKLRQRLASEKALANATDDEQPKRRGRQPAEVA